MEAVQHYAHDLLSQVIPAPLFWVLARFSNLVYRLVLGVSNDPSSWSSTLLPPLVALFTFYLAALMVYRTVRSTIALVWWSVKWGAVCALLLALWAWWAGETDAIHSTGEPSKAGLLSLGGLLRDMPALGGAASLATWLPFLAAAANQPPAPAPRAASARARRAGTPANAARRRWYQRQGSATPARTEAEAEAEAEDSFARLAQDLVGPLVDAQQIGAQAARFAPLLHSIGLVGLLGGQPSDERQAQRRGQRGTAGAGQRAGAGRRRAGLEAQDEAWGAGAFDLGAGVDLGDDADDLAFLDDSDVILDGPASRTRSRSNAANRRRAQRQRQADTARASRRRVGGQGGIADVDNTRRELSEMFQGVVRDLFG